jgi:hypothetical protein
VSLLLHTQKDNPAAEHPHSATGNSAGDCSISSKFSTLNSSESKALKLLAQTVTRIEQLCTQHQLVPANLPAPSRQSYAWMKFLLDEPHLLLHIQAQARVQHLAAVLLSNTTTLSKQSNDISYNNLDVEFINMAGLYKYKSNSNRRLLQIHEGFIAASDLVLVAIVQTIILGKAQIQAESLEAFSIRRV